MNAIYIKRHQAYSSRLKHLNPSIHCLQSAVKMKNMRVLFWQTAGSQMQLYFFLLHVEAVKIL